MSTIETGKHSVHPQFCHVVQPSSEASEAIRGSRKSIFALSGTSEPLGSFTEQDGNPVTPVYNDLWAEDTAEQKRRKAGLLKRQ